MRRSSVMLTAPSVEFSTGTTPYSTRVCSTSSKTSEIDRDGAYVGPLPKCWSAAWCVNVARGPRNATDSARSSARHPDKISRQIARIAAAGSGPPLAADRRVTISASRSGAYDGRSCRRLRSPIWRAASARWLRKWRIWLSRSLILERQSSRFIRTPDRSSLANTNDYRLWRSDGARRRCSRPQSPHFGGRQRAPGAHAKTPESNRTEADAPQMAHGMTERFAIALDLVLAAFTERQMEPATLGARALEAHREWNGGAVFERHTSPPALEVGPAHAARDLRFVEPRQAVPRMQQSVGEGAVVGEHEQALDVHVEPPDRKKARVGSHQVRHHRAAVGVAARSQIAAGLVEEDVFLPFGCRQ